MEPFVCVQKPFKKLYDHIQLHVTFSYITFITSLDMYSDDGRQENVPE